MVVDFVPTHVGSDVKPAVHLDDMGRIAEPGGGLFHHVAGYDCGLRGVQAKAHDAFRFSAVLDSDEGIAG